jgi:CYTH domain-containing protein
LAEVDVYDFWQDRATLEFELESEAQSFTFPSCVRVIREITADARYKNVNLARELPQEDL